jgi:hypothetical protein
MFAVVWVFGVWCCSRAAAGCAVCYAPTALRAAGCGCFFRRCAPRVPDALYLADGVSSSKLIGFTCFILFGWMMIAEKLQQRGGV